MTPLVTISNNTFITFFPDVHILLVWVGFEILIPKGGMLPQGTHIAMVPLNWKPTPPA